MEVEEEIEGLKAIFCRAGELMVKKDYCKCHIIVSFNDEICKSSQLNMTLSEGYPLSELPQVTLNCPLLTGSVSQSLTDKVIERAFALMGQPMLMDLICYTQDLLAKEIENTQRQERSLSPPPHPLGDKALSPDSTGRNCPRSVEDSNEQSDHVTTLLQLDHMRSKQNYIKLIKKWVLELCITGRLVFCNRLILIILQGDARNVKEYIVRNRTNNVDVDSKGRSCKEKMLSVICEVPTKPSSRLTDFTVLELETIEKLHQLFVTMSLEEIYHDYVSGLLKCKHSMKRTNCKP